MKEILITNDDGFEAKGLLALRDALKGIANVTVVAPSSEKSACSHSLTLTRPLKFIQLDDNFFKLDDATPGDCVYLALKALYKNKPDLVLSGINHGANVAEDITYSGTCGGAMEGVLHGIPSIAISQFYMGNSLENFGFDLACEISVKLVEQIFSHGFPLPPKQFLNLNIPAVSKNDYKGLKVVETGDKYYQTDAQIGRNPRGIEYYWLGQPTFDFDPEKNANSDICALYENYATLTPLWLNLTSYSQLKRLNEWLK